MTLFLPATVPARDRNGDTAGAAQWQFFYENSLTAAPTSNGSSSAIASETGNFPSVNLDANITYRAVLKSADGRVLSDITSVIDRYFAAGSQAVLENGSLVPGATWNFFTTATSVPQSVFADPDLTVSLGATVTANASAVFPEMYLGSGVTYKAILKRPDGTDIATIDPVNRVTMLQFLDPEADTSFAFELSGIGSATVGEGFASQLQVTGYTATAGRFRLTSTGFVRCAANEERLCYNTNGTFRGQYLEGADTYYSAPWDVASPNTSSDPAYLTTNSGGTIAYAGDHSEGDIFGGTGGGVLITQADADGGFHNATNVAATGVTTGDVLRHEALVAITAATDVGTVGIGGNGNVTFAQLFDHNAAGEITGFAESWSTTRAGFHFVGTYGGKKWYFIWADRLAANTNDQQARVQYTSVSDQTGRKIHYCDIRVRKNPATAPYAVPVCAANKTFAADTLATAITGAGYVLDGLALARSVMTSGAIVPPAVSVGVPYEPLETRIEIVTSAEVADRSGIMPNVNHRLYGRAWGNPTTLNLAFGPAWFPRDTVTAAGTAEDAGTINVRSVFQARKDALCRLSGFSTAPTRLGNISLDKVIILPTGDPRTEYWQQTSVQNSTGSSTRLIANNDVSFTNGLFLGQTLWTSLAHYSVQADDTDGLRVYIGELCVETQSGGDVSIAGSRIHNTARCSLFSFSRTTPIALDTTGAAFTQFWMDAFYIGRGTVNTWAGDDMFGALTTAFQSLFFCQTEQPIRVSEDAGETWEDLDASGLTIPELPHGELGEHIGTMDFDTGVVTSAPDATKSLRVRYWFPDNSRPNVFGYQYHASQMDMGTHERWPDSGDVFRIKKGNLWLDVPYQAGRYTNVSTYSRTASNGGPATAASGISNDFVQINRTDVVLSGTYTLDGAVWIGPKGGFFLTGNPQLNANGSVITGMTVQNNIGVHNGTNGFRFDWSLQAASTATLRNAVFVEARSDRTLLDGQGRDLTIGAAGPNNTLTFDNVTIISGANVGGLANADSGATYVDASEVTTILAGRRSNFDTFAAPDAKVAQYLPAEFYDTVQGRALLPAPNRVFDFRFNTFAETDTGLSLNSVIETAVGNHPDWNPVIATLKAKFHRAPAARPIVYVPTAVGATLATGLTGSGFDLRDGGNHEGYFALNNGTLTLAKRPPTGVGGVYPLQTAAGQMLVATIYSLPVFTSNAIQGTAVDGATLTANTGVTGLPAPALTYQWKKNGTDISGQTGRQMVINATTMGLVNGDTISCLVTATNSSSAAASVDTATVQPSTTFSA